MRTTTDLLLCKVWNGRNVTLVELNGTLNVLGQTKRLRGNDFNFYCTARLESINTGRGAHQGNLLLF